MKLQMIMYWVRRVSPITLEQAILPVTFFTTLQKRKKKTILSSCATGTQAAVCQPCSEELG